MVTFLAVAAAANVGLALALDFGPPRLRDPEYGKRLARIQLLAAKRPTRPVVAVLGSSRVAMGVRPGVLDDAGPEIANLALTGSGPVMELLVLRRLLADGVTPAAVLVEYWPAMLREDGLFNEAARFDFGRLRPVDRATVREFFPDPPAIEANMLRRRLPPWLGHRRSLLDQTCGGWLPFDQRTNGSWEKLDPWGWQAGRVSVTAAEQLQGLRGAATYYVPLFYTYAISPDADRALRTVVAECRARGISVGLLYLPEAAAFRAMMPPAAQQQADAYLARIRADLGVPLIDGRGWVPDDALADGFHLTQDGAAAFTAKLKPALLAAFPELSAAKR